ncbi:MAG: hypothetical protein M1825_000045 [Sarcosagium campestre]|nr:MAG: hypothetical protein M1825_000045 [Sarcosagium campestre]
MSGRGNGTLDHRPWDFSTAIDLLRSFSKDIPTDEFKSNTSTAELVATSPDLRSSKPSSSSLGDFARVWNFLGHGENSLLSPTNNGKLEEGMYHSPAGLVNGADSLTPKAVRWRDEDGVADLEDNVDPVSSPTITKSRLKRERKLARARQFEEASAKVASRRRDVLDASDADHFDSETGTDGIDRPVGSDPIPITRLQKSAIRRKHDHDMSGVFSTSPLSSASPPKISQSPSRSGLSITKSFLSQSWPIQIEPLKPISSADRKAKLVRKLVEDFPGDRQTLLHAPIASDPSLPSSSINEVVHVFIDSSNIMVGFYDTLKKLRGISEGTYTRRPPLSFHGLALILERGRRVKKRVLVGSQPLAPPITEVQACGYETSILDRVLKSREPHHPKYKGRLSANGNTTSGPSSGSEASVAPQRLVEQAVDEILHLKMLESLVDSPGPGIMVLATGDAAEAEYSEGFMRMVTRALEKGWVVELVSFSRNMSFSYRRKEFRSQWAERFQVLELDKYCEELLDL